MSRESEGHEHVEGDTESSLDSDEQEEGKWEGLHEEAELTDESALREYEESLRGQHGEEGREEDASQADGELASVSEEEEWKQFVDSTLSEYERSLNDSTREDETVVRQTEGEESSCSAEQKSKASEAESQVADSTDSNERRQDQTEEDDENEKAVRQFLQQIDRQIEEPNKRTEAPTVEYRQDPSVDGGDEVDGVMLTDKATLRFVENEGLIMSYENVNYKIASIERESVADLDFVRYRTEQREQFLYVPEEGKLIPPTERTWYSFPSTTEVYLDTKYKHELLEEAVSRAGGIVELRHRLEEKGTSINPTFVYKHLHGLREGMREDRLIGILRYLGRDLDEPNSHIIAIGHGRAIENPTLPFKTCNLDGVRIVAGRLSDGTNSASQGRGPEFYYANKNEQSRNRIEESLRRVFSGANITNRQYFTGEVEKVRTSTDIIGYTLEAAGAIIGSVTDKNPEAPTWIQQGSIEFKREWLVQTFGDEGSTWPQRGLVTLTRSVEAAHTLTDEQRSQLGVLKSGWKEKPVPEGWKGKPEKYCKFDDLPEDIQHSLSLCPPRLLEFEENTLRNDFGVDCHSYAREVYERDNGYGVTWVLQTKSREDTRRFYEEIGFPQSEKQAKLRRTLRIEGDND